jgi:hypothetical protein
MALQHISLDRVDEAQLQSLIDGKASETREIEYKRETYGNADKDYAEYLADVSSFANTVGGDLVIGMAASNGVPTGFAPFPGNCDAEILRLENIARAGVEPRITNLAIRTVPLKRGGSALVIRVPRSYNPPHRITRAGPRQHRFYARSSAGKYEPNVDQLRALFNTAPQLADRMRDFRFERLAKICAGATPVPLLDHSALVLHVIPFSAFDTRLALPLGRGIEWYNKFPPVQSNYPSNFRINVDGLLTLSNAQPNAKAHRAYAQLYHSGIVETVASSFVRRDDPKTRGRLTALNAERSIVQWSHLYLSSLLWLGCRPPFAVLVSLIGVENTLYSFSMGNSLFEDEAGAFDRDQFHFSEVVVEEIPDTASEYAHILRPLLNEIANAAGRALTPTFDASGQYRVKVDG